MLLGTSRKSRRADNASCTIGFSSFTERDNQAEMNLLKLSRESQKVDNWKYSKKIISYCGLPAVNLWK